MSNKVLITNDQNVVKVPSGLRILIRRSCNAVLDFEHFDGPAEISVTFVDNNRIHELNKEYRDKDSATDVLSSVKTASMTLTRTTAASCWATSSSRWSAPWSRPSCTAILCSVRSRI